MLKSLCAGVALAALAAGPAAGANPGIGAVKGEAYGSRALLRHASLPTVTIGRVARQGLPCVVDRDRTINNHVNQSHVVGGIDTPVLVDTSTVDNTGAVDIEPGRTDVLETSVTQGVDILDGLITAEVVKAQAHATLEGSPLPNLHTAEGDPVPTGAQFVNLDVAGTPISANPPPNTRIDLPNGIGTVTLNAIARENFIQVLGGHTQVRNVAIHVKLTNLAGYTGEIIVGLARAGIQASDALLRAEAYELKATLGAVTSVGKQNYLHLPCFVSGERHMTENAASVRVNPLGITSDTLTSTVDGVIGVGASSTRAIARIQNLDIAGLVTASLVRPHANASTSTGVFGVDANDAGTEFLNLTVGDRSFSATPEPNTKLEVPGLGTVELNRQLCTAYYASGPDYSDSYFPTAVRPCGGTSGGAKLIVTGIVVTVLDPASGLPPGLEIRVAEALVAILI